jgi:porin
MSVKFAAVALPACALACLAAAHAAQADDKPATGVPEESIAQDWNDPVRAAFAQRGILYGVNWTGEYFNVLSGGNSTGSSFDGKLEVFTDVNLETLVGWKGAVVHANGFYIHGIGPSTEHVGNLFAVSNVEALETVRLFEIWFEQSLLDDKLKVRIGQLGADSDFFISQVATQFFNGTFGWAGIVASDMTQGGPAYPLTSLGVRAAYSPNDNLTILAAVFNGSPADPNAEDPQKDNRHGTEFRLGDAPLAMVEGQFKYDAGLPGTVKLGGWKQFNNNFSDPVTGDVVIGDYGLYGIIDQRIWKAGDDKGVSVFARVSGSPDRQNLIDTYFDTGIVFSGFVPGRTKDSFGAAFGYGKISNRVREAQELAGDVVSSYEAALEVNYIAHISPGFSIVPDFQYIWNPGGGIGSDADPSKPIEDSVVIGVRTNISY